MEPGIPLAVIENLVGYIITGEYSLNGVFFKQRVVLFFLECILDYNESRENRNCIERRHSEIQCQ